MLVDSIIQEDIGDVFKHISLSYKSTHLSGDIRSDVLKKLVCVEFCSRAIS